MAPSQQTNRRQQFFIGCRLPGMNDITAWSRQRAGKWNKYAEMKALYQSLIRHDIRRANLTPVTAPVMIHLRWVEPNAKRDLDNIRAGVKFILDALVAQNILQNDTRKQVVGFTDAFEVDKAKPGVHVSLEEVG